MAGISLPLRSLLGSRSFLAQAAGYAYSALAMAGPWLLTSFHMLLLGRLDLPGITLADLQAFQSVVLYSYGGSMVLTGLLQLPAARHLSDRLFVKDRAAVVPSFTGTAILSLVLHAAAGMVAVILLRPPPALAIAEGALLGSVGFVSTGMIFLGVLRSFPVILGAFVVGIGTALTLSRFLGPALGLPGLVAGFAAGHGLIGAVFLSRLRAEFPASGPWAFGVLSTAARRPALIVIGLATAAAIWVDKVVFWASPWAVRTAAGLWTCPLYDNGFFLASFTVIPALVVIFVRLEGSFHDKYAQFYEQLRRGADLQSIRAGRAEIVESFLATLLRIAVIQGMVTMAAILLAPLIVQHLGLDWISFYVFRAACLGVYVQMLALAVLLSAVHLALYRVAVTVSLIHFAANAAGAWATRLAGPEYLGFGAVAAGALALAVGYPWVRSILSNLERHTFMGQVGA